MQVRLHPTQVDKLGKGPDLHDVLTPQAIDRGVAVQSALFLLAQFTDGDLMTSDVLEVARFINSGEI